MIADLHCDTISKLRDYRLKRISAVLQEDVLEHFEATDVRSENQAGLWQNPFHLDIRRMKNAGYMLQNFAVYIDSQLDTDVYGAYREMYADFKEEIEKNREHIRQVFSYSDIELNRQEGRMSAILTVEEGQVADSVERLDTLYRDGVRLITLTWNHKNAIGCPNCIRPDGTQSLSVPNTENGLTPYGFDLIHRMEEKHMMIDVSHLSDRGFYDVYENTEKPFLASHSNAREVTWHVRNLTDDMIRKIAERGGVIGVNFETSFLGKPKDCGIAAVLRHADHIRKIGGEDCLAIGSDFDGIKGNPELKGVQDMKLLSDALQKAGWKQSVIDKMLWENTMRFYREIL